MPRSPIRFGRGRFLRVKCVLGGFVGGGGWWLSGKRSPERRQIQRAKSARPVGSHHGSYQLRVAWFWANVMRHMRPAGWLSQSTSPM
jgi:hypothetical protein